MESIICVPRENIPKLSASSAITLIDLARARLNRRQRDGIHRCLAMAPPRVRPDLARRVLAVEHVRCYAHDFVGSQ